MSSGSHHNIVDFSKYREGVEKDHPKSHFTGSVRYAYAMISDKQLLLSMMAQETGSPTTLKPKHGSAERVMMFLI